MLTESQRDTIVATLPLVGGAINEIASVFYGKLFDAHPQLHRDLFNRGNQANGAQQAALANSIAVYATLLVSEKAEDRALLERIAHKHASLGVAPEQYPVVYEHLFAAIVDVLGADVVTAPVSDAWTAVYWLMADDLIARERQLYAESGTTPAHTFSPVVVVDRDQQSPVTVSFTLAATDGAPLPEFLPGQYISLGVRLPDGARQIRQYSLCSAVDGRWRISVRRDGEVSSHLHDCVFEGSRLEASHPFGDVYLQSGPQTPLVLLSAGIGLTPVLGILYAVESEQQGRSVVVAHADRTPAMHAHRAELTGLVERIPGAQLTSYYDQLPTGYALRANEREGRVQLSEMSFPAGAHFYLCGPEGFMTQMHTQLLASGIDASAIFLEAFTPVAS